MSTPAWKIELKKINSAQNPAYALNGLVRANAEMAMQIYEETNQADFWQTLSDNPNVQGMVQQLRTKASESNATAIALQEVHQQLSLDVPAVVTGITLAYLQHTSVSQKAKEVANNKTLKDIQKTAFKVSKPSL